MSAADLEKNLFNLKFTAKQLQMSAKKSAKEEIAEKNKVKKAIQQGNVEIAKIYAENAIRKKNEMINYLRLSARIDAVSARVQTALTMRKITSSMTSVVKNMDKALASMNLEKISMVMDKFEQQFEDIDVQTAYTEKSISSSTTVMTPEDQVKELMQQVADEHHLELKEELVNTPSSTMNAAGANKDEADLNERLAKLRSLNA